MKYLTQINEFNRWLDGNYLPANSQLMWYKLMHMNNRCNWQEWFSVDNIRLAGLINAKNESAVIRARDKLVECGLIEYRKGWKGTPNEYHIIKFEQSVKDEVQTQVQTIVEMQDIKEEDKEQNKTFKEKNIKKKESDGGGFIPPTIEEINTYCQERNNRVDSQAFADFYTSKGWYVGKNKMKDWKAAVRMWERNFRGIKSEKPKKEFKTSSFDAEEFFNLALKRSYENIKSDE